MSSEKARRFEVDLCPACGSLMGKEGGWDGEYTVCTNCDAYGPSGENPDPIKEVEVAEVSALRAEWEEELAELRELRTSFEAELDRDADYIYGEAAKQFFNRFDELGKEERDRG
jgi:hypothetical protein